MSNSGVVTVTYDLLATALGLPERPFFRLI